MMTVHHEPVMTEEVLHYLDTPARKRVVDGTVGGGGHASEILRASDTVELLGIDRDEDALETAKKRLEPYRSRIRLVQGAYSGLADYCREAGWDSVDAVLLDLGVSSHQIDTPARGFSHRTDGPLDMRMDRRSPTTAAKILNESTEDELTRIFREYGEERNARRVARAVVRRRAEKPWSRTGDFAELINRVVGHSGRHGPPPATRCFQALRIAVNRELDELRDGLAAAEQMVEPGGRIVVISFHSLEDRIVKQAFRYGEATCVCPPDMPVCRCGKKATLRTLTRKPVRPTAAEVANNRRAASAKLRAAEKLNQAETSG